MSYSINKLAITLITGIYIAIALFGMSIFIIGSEYRDMTGGGCPLMRDAGSLCQTGILDHITHWNMLFATTISVLIVYASVIALAYAPVRAAAVSLKHERYKRYAKAHPQSRFFQNIVALFSDGIVQPKIFV